MIIAGYVYFDLRRDFGATSALQGIPGVPVVLQNYDAPHERLAVYTDNTGRYEFTEVPAGGYFIVEAYGESAVQSPGDFTEAVSGPLATAAVPPISFVPNAPASATNLDCVTPNTLIVTVGADNLVDQDFINGPVAYIPIQVIMDDCAAVEPDNLLVDADFGTIGSFPAGTPANTGADPNPYPGLAPDFTYMLPDSTAYVPFDGEYTIQNIMNNALSNTIGAWWRIADHTTGNEQGRMMVINGYDPGAVFFFEQVTVQPHTRYLFSAWILNMFDAVSWAPPQLGVEIQDGDGNILYKQTLDQLIPVNTQCPEWRQIGTVFNSHDNTTLTLKFSSEAPAAVGNDYAIDDITLHEIHVPEFIPVKSIDKSEVIVGETVVYTVTLTNTCTEPLTDVMFLDNLPNGSAFVPGSVTINNAVTPLADPAVGFTLPDIPGGETVTVRFSAVAESAAAGMTVTNSAEMEYGYSPVAGGIPEYTTVESNDVSLRIEDGADIWVTKTTDVRTVNPGDVLIYHIVAGNNGPQTAENVVLTDPVPANLLNPEYSTYYDPNDNAPYQPWPGSLQIGNLAVNQQFSLFIRGIVNPEPVNTLPLRNTASVSSDTPDPILSNNQSTVIVRFFNAREQAVIDLIESVALQEAAMAHIMNAEGEKMQAFLQLDNVTTGDLMALNATVIRLVRGMAQLEAVLQDKLQTTTGNILGLNPPMSAGQNP